MDCAGTKKLLAFLDKLMNIILLWIVLMNIILLQIVLYSGVSFVPSQQRDNEEFVHKVVEISHEVEV
jgi:hypothetical protein